MVVAIGTETVFFSNVEPYRNRSFRLAIDGFGFLVLINRAALASWLCIEH